MERIERDGIVWYESSLLRRDGVVHGFGCKDIAVEAYVRVLCAAALHIPQMRQVHGAAVHVVENSSVDPLEGDALCTDRQGIVLPIRTADCLPILWCDVQTGVVGAIHAGWRGIAARVISASIRTAMARYECAIHDLRFAIGPAMGPACYEVSADVTTALESIGHDLCSVATPSRDGRCLLNLASCAATELGWNGIAAEQIDRSAICTHCATEEFHSYRREPNTSGRQTAFIWRV